MPRDKCHHKFTLGIDDFLKKEPVETAQIYEEMKRRFPECINDKRCDHGYGRSELAGFEWQHMTRRAQQSLQRKNIIRLVGSKWYHLGIEQNLSRIEEEEVEKSYRKLDLGKIRQELREITEHSPVYEYVNGTRYKRDNATVAKIKIIRGFKCQICGYAVKTKNGGYYIEGAHISEKKHGGPELPGNILILCPNHHKEFDLGERIVQYHDNSVVKFTLNSRYYEIDVSV